MPGGLQGYIELRKYNESVLIDRFVVDTPSIPDYHQGPFIVRGLFGLAEMNISTSVICSINDCGQFCEIEGNCSSCLPGFTGTYCSEMISACTDSLCNGSNMRCVDRENLEYECECKSGFMGADCQVDVDECSDGVELCSSHGKCVNDEGSHHCECEEHYTGENCETLLPRYSVEVTFHSFENANGRCADVGGTCANGTGCCESLDCRDIRCNYMFLFCLRPSGTPLSTIRTENRGGDSCNAIETNSVRTSNGDNFLSSLYGVRNPTEYALDQRVSFCISSDNTNISTLLYNSKLSNLFITSQNELLLIYYLTSIFHTACQQTRTLHRALR